MPWPSTQEGQEGLPWLSIPPSVRDCRVIADTARVSPYTQVRHTTEPEEVQPRKTPTTRKT